MVHIIFLLNRVIINKCCKNLQEERNNELEQSPKEMELLITNDVKSTQTSLFTHTHIQREGQVGEGIGSHNWEVYGVFWDCRQPSHPPCQKSRVKTGRILMMLFESQIHNILGKPGKQEKKKKKKNLFSSSFSINFLEKILLGQATPVVGRGQSTVIYSLIRVTPKGGMILQQNQRKGSRKAYVEDKSRSYYAHYSWTIHM